VRAAEVQRSQSGADNIIAELLHQERLAGWDAIPKLAGDR
jgi:hypothetical protein